MLDFLFTIGQVGAAMVVFYGALLSMGAVKPAQEDEIVLLKHLQHDA
jgi:hypothetical protein